jgi:hypothetical protein
VSGSQSWQHCFFVRMSAKLHKPSHYQSLRFNVYRCAAFHQHYGVNNVLNNNVFAFVNDENGVRFWNVGCLWAFRERWQARQL